MNNRLDSQLFVRMLFADQLLYEMRGRPLLPDW